eukprot:1180850-Prorocentrum_minimum.AAC.1
MGCFPSKSELLVKLDTQAMGQSSSKKAGTNVSNAERDEKHVPLKSEPVDAPTVKEAGRGGASEERRRSASDGRRSSGSRSVQQREECPELGDNSVANGTTKVQSQAGNLSEASSQIQFPPQEACPAQDEPELLQVMLLPISSSEVHLWKVNLVLAGGSNNDHYNCSRHWSVI